MKHENEPGIAQDPLAALQVLEDRFTQWRKNKSHARETIPLELLQAAQTLTQHLDHAKVRNRLGVTHEQLNRARACTTSTDTTTPLNPSFVEAKPTGPMNPSPSARIEIHWPNGVCLTLTGIKESPVNIMSRFVEGIG